VLAVEASTACSITVIASQDHFETGSMSSELRFKAVPVNSAGTEVAGNYTATVKLLQAPAAVVSVVTNVTTANNAGESAQSPHESLSQLAYCMQMFVQSVCAHLCWLSV
jgi:hypothetical protein